MKRCTTKFCKNRCTGKHCSTCRSRQSRANNPVRYSYNNLKSNAKRRKKIFELTLEEFESFCTEYNYMTGKGKTKTSLSIDCVINEKGYVRDNIRALPLGENARKGTKILHYDWVSKQATVINTRIEAMEDAPF